MEQAKTTEKEKKEIKINATHTKKYLDMLVSYISTQKKIYLDSMESEINEDFVKSFSRK